MIYGIGIDIVTVSRLEKWLNRKDYKKLVMRFFNELEIKDAFASSKTIALSLSARFAAKEAFGKALGTGLKGIKLKDICVKSSHNGKPALQLFGTAKNAITKTCVKNIFVSLSHENEFAIAIVILES